MTEITYTEALEESAAARVIASPALHPYDDLLTGYDWQTWDEHLAWVSSAPEAEIIAWAKAIRRDETAEKEATP